MDTVKEFSSKINSLGDTTPEWKDCSADDSVTGGTSSETSSLAEITHEGETFSADDSVTGKDASDDSSFVLEKDKYPMIIKVDILKHIDEFDKYRLFLENMTFSEQQIEVPYWINSILTIQNLEVKESLLLNLERALKIMHVNWKSEIDIIKIIHMIFPRKDEPIDYRKESCSLLIYILMLRTKFQKSNIALRNRISRCSWYSVPIYLRILALRKKKEEEKKFFSWKNLKFFQSALLILVTVDIILLLQCYILFVGVVIQANMVCNKYAVSYGLVVKSSFNSVVVIQRKIPYCVQDFLIHMSRKKVFYPFKHVHFSVLRKQFELEWLPRLKTREIKDYQRFLNGEVFEDEYDFPHGQARRNKKFSLNKYLQFRTAYREFQEESGFHFTFTKKDIENYPLVWVNFEGLDGFQYKQYYFIVDNAKDLRRHSYFNSFKASDAMDNQIKSWNDDRLVYNGQLISLEKAFEKFSNQQILKCDMKHLLCLNSVIFRPLEEREEENFEKNSVHDKMMEVDALTNAMSTY